MLSALLGIDLILTPEGHWVVLEANSHPQGLLAADELSRQCAQESSLGANALAAVARQLVRAAGGGLIALLLPDWFVIQTDHHSSSSAISLINESDALQDLRVARVIAEFNALLVELRGIGARACIFDIHGLRPVRRGLKSLTDEPVALVFRRAGKFPGTAADTPCVNDLRVHLVCIDKLRFFETAAAGGFSDSLPRTTAYVPALETLDLVQCSRTGYVITKPRFGCASEEVRRLSASAALVELAEGNSRASHVCQEWIQPSAVRAGAEGYYYDIRAYTLNSRIIGGFARRAAAPYEGVAADSPLAWLTTTGPCWPVCFGDHSGAGPCVELTAAQRRSLEEVCRTVSDGIRRAAACMEQERAASEVPPLLLHLAPGEEVRLIRLVEAGLVSSAVLHCEK
jgi:hypothetical protein